MKRFSPVSTSANGTSRRSDRPHKPSTSRRVAPQEVDFLIGSAPVLLHTLDRNYCFADIGEAFLRAFGYTRKELVGKHVSDLVTEESAKRMRTRAVPTFERDGGTSNNQYTFVRKDGTTFEGMVSAHARVDAAGQFAGAISVIMDLTGRDETARELEWKTEMLKRSQALAQVGHWRVNMADQSLLWSDEVFRIHGVDRDDFDLTVENAIDAYHPEDRQLVADAVAAAMATGAGYTLEARIVRPDGEVRDVWSSGEVVFGTAGEVESLFGVFQDITTSKKAERSRLLLEKAIDSAADSIGFIVADGSLIYVNDVACTSTGYSREEMLGMHINQVDIERRPWEAGWNAIREAGTMSFETTHRRKDGSSFPVHVVAEYLEFEGVGYICARARNIEARKRQEIELRQAKEAAEAAVRARDQFLAMMSHEIRTPMNGVIGMASLLQDSGLDEAQQELADIIRSSGAHLLAILNDILDFSKVEAGRIVYEAHPFHVRECFYEGVELLSASAVEKDLELNVTFATDVPAWIRSDATRVRQILFNLVGNAVKFTDAGFVKVNVAWDIEADQSMLCVAVTDSGIGIPADRIAHLFAPFVQADASTTRRYGGTGLGLAICKRLCEGLGGSIDVASTVGVGTTFTFRIPVEAAEPPDDATIAPSPSQPQDELRILLAEDNSVNQRVTLRMLERLGYHADAVADGSEVLIALKRTSYDVILMDVRMPIVDGHRTTRAIREGGGEQPYIIALTADIGAEEKQRCIDAGMDDHLPKPVGLGALTAALAKALA